MYIVRIKYIKGKENIILSSLSYNPPCPLSKFPKSLISNSLLIFDWTRSPKIAKEAVIRHKIIENKISELKYDEIIKLYAIEKMIEPTAPSMVLFGDNDSYSLFLPRLFPTK